jgi:hypothetical protein
VLAIRLGGTAPPSRLPALIGLYTRRLLDIVSQLALVASLLSALAALLLLALAAWQPALLAAIAALVLLTGAGYSRQLAYKPEPSWQGRRNRLLRRSPH